MAPSHGLAEANPNRINHICFTFETKHRAAGLTWRQFGMSSERACHEKSSIDGRCGRIDRDGRDDESG
jgi:hypothetical protein